MAPLPSRFDVNAFEINAMLVEGRKEDAITAVVALLRSGASLEVQFIAANLLRPNRGKVGRKKEKPKHWYEIGTGMEELISDGKSSTEAKAKVAELYGYSESHVQNAYRYFTEAKEE